MKQTSIVQQWVISVALSMLPLVFAVTFALWTINNQAQAQRELLKSTLQLQNATSQFQEELNNAERSIRQFLLLKDKRFKAIYLQRYQAVSESVERVLANSLVVGWISEKPEQARGFQIVLERLKFERIVEQDSERVGEDFQLMDAFAKQIQADVQQIIADALNHNENTFDQAIRTLVLLGLVVLPITILLFLYSSRRISTPFRKLTYSILRMGRGVWKYPVAIQGPSDIVSLGENLEWMRLKLIEADQQKQEFLGHITHELKTPLASIIEASSLLYDEVPGSINPKQQNVVKILQQNADSLKLRIEQLLNYNQVIQLKSCHSEKVELRGFISEIISHKSLLHSDTEVIWKLAECPLNVDADPRLLEMIFTNLFSNAIYYSNSPVVIQVHWYPYRNGWQCFVSDNGKGIAKEHLPKIYEPFYQGSNQRKGTLKGSGIGLAIVNKCVTNLNGAIQVVSDVGMGTEFCLKFPAAIKLDNRSYR